MLTEAVSAIWSAADRVAVTALPLGLSPRTKSPGMAVTPVLFSVSVPVWIVVVPTNVLAAAPEKVMPLEAVPPVLSRLCEPLMAPAKSIVVLPSVVMVASEVSETSPERVNAPLPEAVRAVPPMTSALGIVPVLRMFSEVPAGAVTDPVPRAPALFVLSVPALTVVPPSNVLALVRARVPEPALVREKLLAASSITPDSVSVEPPPTSIRVLPASVIGPGRVLAPEGLETAPIPPAPVPASVNGSAAKVMPVPSNSDAPSATVVPAAVAPREFALVTARIPSLTVVWPS